MSSTKNFILLFLSASDDTGGKVGRSDRQVGPTRNNNFPPGLRCLENSHYWQYGHTKLHVCMHYAWVYGGFSDFLTCFFSTTGFLQWRIKRKHEHGWCTDKTFEVRAKLKALHRHSLQTGHGNEMPEGYSVSDLHTFRVHTTEYDSNKELSIWCFLTVHHSIDLTQ